MLLMQTGAKRVVVRSPVFAAVAGNAVAVIGTTAVVNGGAGRTRTSTSPGSGEVAFTSTISADALFA